LGKGDSNEGKRLSARGDNSGKVKKKINLKVFFSRTSKPIEIKLGTKYTG
jgi:hypothetical protein